MRSGFRLAVALLLCLSAGGVYGQSATGTGSSLRRIERIHLDDVHPGVGGERIVEIYLRILTQFGAPVSGLAPDDLEVWQDDDRIDTEDLKLQALEASGRGITAVLAIDASGTMKGGPFDRARQAALAFLDLLSPVDRVAVVTFAENIQIVASFEMQRPETRQALRTLAIDPEKAQHTLLYDGVYRAVDLIRSSPHLPRRAFVILFSDGADGGSDREESDVLRACEGRGDLPQVLIFSIGYARFGGGGLKDMERLAAGTGGDFLEAVSMIYLQDFFDSIATQMLKSYVLSFPASMDGQSHELRVTANRLTASRIAQYPDMPGSPWPWVVALGVLGVLGVSYLLVQAGSVKGRLSIVSGPSAGQVVALKSGRTRIGALDDNEVILPQETVSRYHAEIVARGRRVQICDLGSKNGTQVNGQPIRKSPLRSGDRIKIADIELIFER